MDFADLELKHSGLRIGQSPAPTDFHVNCPSTDKGSMVSPAAAVIFQWTSASMFRREAALVLP